MTCEDTSELAWAIMRFPGRCYFYPGRDCPGWIAGGRCGRTGDQIPPDAEAAQAAAADTRAARITAPLLGAG